MKRNEENMAGIRKEKSKQDQKSGRFVTEPLADRFARKYVKHDSGCWIWISTSSVEGKGIRRAQIRVKGKYIYAARVSYELNVGPIPDGMKILHQCDNPLCVNPEHLFPGTNSDNVIDAIQKGRFTQHLDNLAKINHNRSNQK